MFCNSAAFPFLFFQGKYVLLSPLLLAGHFAVVDKVMESSTLWAVNKGIACTSSTPAPQHILLCIELEEAEQLGARSCSPWSQRGVWHCFQWEQDRALSDCCFNNDCWKCQISASYFLEQCGQTCKISNYCFNESPAVISFDWCGMHFLGWKGKKCLFNTNSTVMLKPKLQIDKLLVILSALCISATYKGFFFERGKKKKQPICELEIFFVT